MTWKRNTPPSAGSQFARFFAGASLLATLLTSGFASTGWSDWKGLRLEARSLVFFTGQVELSVRQDATRKYLETATKASFFGAEIAKARSRTTIDPTTGRTLQYYELSEKHGKRYTFGESSYTIEKLDPTNGFDAPIERWGLHSKKEIQYPSDLPAGTAIYDYYGMILHLKDAPLQRPGDAITLYVATSKGAVPYTVRFSEVRSAERKVKDLVTGETRTLPAREFRLRVAPADPEANDEGFLKMEGETEIWVEAVTHTLLEVDGKIPKVPGQVRVELTGIR